MKIRILKVIFDGELQFFEVPAFRGAIAQKVGYEHPLFHNHKPDDGYYYRYPLIQYKLIGRRPAILCMGDGVDQIHHFFARQDWSLSIGQEHRPMKIHKLHLDEFELRLHQAPRTYSLLNWVALNQKNYRLYRQKQGLVAQLAFLEQLLRGNLLAFAKGMGSEVPGDISLHIQRLVNVHPVTVKKQRVLAFTLDFATNLFLPNYIGLGKSVSHGFGSVKEIKELKVGRKEGAKGGKEGRG